jgi:serine/threonine protein kinase
LKPENILVDFDYESKKIKRFKIIDFGSSFTFSKINSGIELTTPEYLAPDILDYLDNKTQVLM